MTLLYPIGLLVLLVIPVLVAIYILKNKYTEQVVSATYLWTLSERFLKRKNPISRLTGILSLLMQILIVTVLALAIAQPVFTVKGSANDYCFILDGTGSMNIEYERTTRLEKGKSEIRSLIASSGEGSTYTLIFSGTSADVIFENVTDKERAYTLLSRLSPRYTEANSTAILEEAQKRFNENTSLLVYLVTDKTIEGGENVSVINVASAVENYAVSDVACTLSGGLKVTGNVCSYASSRTLTLNFYLDGEMSGSMSVQTEQGVYTPFSYAFDTVSYRSVRVEIAEQDALTPDNEVTVFNEEKTSAYKTLIVSESPYLIKAALGAADAVTVSEYSGETGYGLYVFDSCAPEALPKDGAVWFFNPTASSENAGFSVQTEIAFSSPARLSYSTSSATAVRSILKNCIGSEVSVAKYVKCGLYRSFITLLSHGGNPVVFAGTNVYGNREVVFAFSLHETDFALMTDFVLLTEGLLSYTFPPVLEKTGCYAGDTVQVNVPAGASGIRVDTPLGGVDYLDTGADIVEYTVEEAGVYTFTLTVGSTARTAQLFCGLPLAERVPFATEEFRLTGEAGDESRDGIYKDLLFAFILIAVIMIADWAVYCYEQYQLR